MAKAAEPCIIACPADRHISVAFQDIYSIVKGSMSLSQREKFEEVAQLMESLYHQEFMVLRRDLKVGLGGRTRGFRARVQGGGARARGLRGEWCRGTGSRREGV